MGRLAGDVVARPGTLARDVHRAVANRTFGALGLVGAPVRVMHDAISGAAYASVRVGLAALPRAGSARLAQRIPAGAAPLSATLRGSIALGALNGAVGDRLMRDHPDLALDLIVRRHGREAATPKLAVFVHGLCETDEAWDLLPLSASPDERRSYGARLHDELGYTPLYVRYNTGLHISDNARRLSEALERTVESWPVEVEEIALVGHSMGGLVSRGACHYGEADGHAWT